MNRASWRDKRVFLTGHTGFKGSWLAFLLTRLGAKVHGYALPPSTEPSLFERSRVGELLASSVIADLRDARAVHSALAEAQPDVVFHLGAQPLVRRSYTEPVETYATNVMGTLHVLEAMRHVPSVRAAVMVTTDKVYENHEWPWGYREIDSLGGHDPYASSKACAELVVAAYRRSFLAHGARPVAVASVRAGNVIGGGDWAEDRLLPDAVRALSNGQPVRIRNPSAVRPWQHVLDLLGGYIALAERLLSDGERFAMAYNLGPDAASVWPVSRVMERVCALWGEGARFEVDGAQHPHETHTLLLDSSKAHCQLGWRPRTTLDLGLEWTISWYRDVLCGADARVRMEQDIQRFEELCNP